MPLPSTLRRCGAAVAAAALLLLVPTPASAVDFGLGGNVSLDWSVPNAPSGHLTNITFPMAINPASEQTGLYYAQQFGVANGKTGYTGLQPQPTSGNTQKFRAVFSVFASGGAGTPADTSSNDANCKPGADGGAGQSCSVLFNAEYGHSYYLAVKREASTSTTSTWTGDVFDDSNLRSFVAHIGSWTVPSGLLNSSGSGFVEYVYYDAAGRCDQNTVSDAYFGGPSSTDAGGLSGVVNNVREYGSCAGQANFASTPWAGSGQHIVRGFTSTSPIKGSASGLCLNSPSQDPEGAQANIVACDGTTKQLWNFRPNSRSASSSPVTYSPLSPEGLTQGFLRLEATDPFYHYMCLDNNGESAPGGKVTIRRCRSRDTNQQWRLAPDGTLRTTDSDLCIDVAGGATGSGSLLVQQTCNGGNSQKWVRQANP
ncbi:RICIN domain-containing protein [Kitasatospora sp. NPDC059973]|uniref:RICIN domain-containing protein n=1 Tax=Kitasatospora sp. NPDC059973 TaxID=3347020 RepID=UPI0036A6B136